MKNNSTELSQLSTQTSRLPLLRIVYKSTEVTERKTNIPAKKARPGKATSKPVAKEPLPQFDDYKFKARDHDPL